MEVEGEWVHRRTTQNREVGEVAYRYAMQNRCTTSSQCIQVAVEVTMEAFRSQCPVVEVEATM
jgi:hypothetical protein